MPFFCSFNAKILSSPDKTVFTRASTLISLALTLTSIVASSSLSSVVLSEQLGEAASCSCASRLFSVELLETDCLLEVSKMDEPDFETEFRAVQLPCKVDINVTSHPDSLFGRLKLPFSVTNKFRGDTR